MAGQIMKGGAFAHNNTTPPAQENVVSLFSCKGKTAIVAGAGAGLGLAVSRALAESGANVAIWYKTNKAAVQRATEIQETYGVICKAYEVDITDSEQVERTVNTVVKDLGGRLDIFVANAGTFPDEAGPMLDQNINIYHQMIAGNLTGTVHCAIAAARHWRRQKQEGTDANGKKLEGYTYGSFVATVSIGGGHVVEVPDLATAYSVSKAGIVQLCKSLAVEWVQFARINCVSPGIMITPATEQLPEDVRNMWKDGIPMGREARTHELKGTYVYLCSDASSYTTGVEIVVDGGRSLL